MSPTPPNLITPLKKKAQILQSLAGALPAEISTRPLLAMIGVAMGAMIGTVNSRLLTVGLPDIRGAMGLGMDESSWVPTVLNSGMMFIGPFSVFLGGLLGPRLVLLWCAGTLTVVSLLLPFAPNLFFLLTLEAIAGLMAGSFYPLALSFILRNLPVRYAIFAIAVYAAGIDFATNIAIPTHGFYMRYLSWHWDYWTAALLTPFMMLFVYLGIPKALPPKGSGLRPSWTGFLIGSAGFALAYAALDQGERLDWLNSGTIIAMLSTAAFLLTYSIARRLRSPNPLVDLPFLRQRNTLLMGTALFFFRFVLLTTIVLVPQYLMSIRGLRPEQISSTLLLVALPQLPLGLLTALLLRRIDSRLPLAVGFFVMALACFLDSRLSSAWDCNDFVVPQIVMALGQGIAFTSLVANIIMQVFAAGALRRANWILTFSAFFHTVRIFGGECGASLITHILNTREKIHSNLTGLHVDTGSWQLQQRLSMLAAGVFGSSNGQDGASARAVGVLSLQLRRQAYTQSFIDGFIVIEWMIFLCLLLIVCLKRTPITYGDLDTVPGIIQPSE